MKKIYNRLAALFLVNFIIACASANYDEFSKSLNKDFDVNKNSTLEVINKYGVIEIDNWDKPSVHIDVKITVEHSDRQEANRLLEMIRVKFSKEGNLISAITEIDKDFGTSNNWFGGRNREGKRFSIDYRISMPSYLNIKLTNKYGNIAINEAGGLAEIDLKYGNLNINKLTRGDEKPLNAIIVSYGKATITEANWLKLNINYSPMASIESCKALILMSKYSKASVDKASSLVAESAYDGYKIGSITNFVLKGKYSHYSVNNISKKIDVEVKYSGFEVDNVPAGFEIIKVENAYGKINIGIAREASYSLDAYVRYAGIKYPDNDRISRISENTSTTVKGIVGSGKPSASVNINSSYGGVDLMK